MTGRWELLRALGAVADDPGDARTALQALGLPVADLAEHTEVFALNCPPYASIHLGSQGGVGGEGADRVAGFWRAIGLTPPAEPDHLAALIGLYANLGEAAEQSRRPATAAALSRMSRALLWEHLWPWTPNYLDAVSDLATPSLGMWAGLTGVTLEDEYRSHPSNRLLPAALRDAPAALDAECGLDELLDALVSPLRSGLVLSHRTLARLAEQTGVGYRIGERRFALRSMFEQDPTATAAALGAEARRWSIRHRRRRIVDSTSRWWAKRAVSTAAALAVAVPMVVGPPRA